MGSLPPATPLVLHSLRRKREIRGLILTVVTINLLTVTCLLGVLVIDSNRSLRGFLCSMVTVLLATVTLPVPIFRLTRGPAQTLRLTPEALLIEEATGEQTINLTELTAMSYLEVSRKARNLEAQHALLLWDAEGRELGRITMNAFERAQLLSLLEALRNVHPTLKVDSQVWQMLEQFE